MGFIELFLLAVGLSMDAFAVSVCAGLTMKRVTVPKALIVGLYFGVFQVAMPLIGYFAARLFADKIVAVDHWVAFALLCFLGGKMIRESLQKEDGHSCESCDYKNCPERPGAEASLKPSKMLPLAVATSIDALAAGITFAVLPDTNIIPAVSFIGVTTLTLSMAGVKIGQLFGVKFKAKAEFAGGVILILMGLKVLLEHLFF
ncbi:MAG: manganese efflux pump MntP family protein [Oscillospiraceae bacterium]|jgi:putative Mn2+ efflux pump MntP|nr:manganese efflux pump MntP family protein [Oscillospiraceae bacterium]